MEDGQRSRSRSSSGGAAHPIHNSRSIRVFPPRSSSLPPVPAVNDDQQAFPCCNTDENGCREQQRKRTSLLSRRKRTKKTPSWGDEETERCHFEELPIELKLLIFSYLTAVQLRLVQCVCLEWRMLGSEASLWKDKYFGPVRTAKKIEWSSHSHHKPPTYRKSSHNHLHRQRLAQYNVVMVGPGGCGRNAFVVHYVQGSFIEKYDPVIEDSFRKMIVVDGVEVVLDLVVTAGQEEYSALRHQYERTADGFLLLYSITSSTSFQTVRAFVQSILRSRGCDMTTCPPIILLANKIDLASTQREVSTKQGKELANSLLQYQWFSSTPSSWRTTTREKKEAGGFCFRDNFFECSVKDGMVVPFGREAIQGEAVVMEEIVRQIDEWRWHVGLKLEQQKAEQRCSNNDKRCILM
ncbi:RAS1 protein [Balamuthia mandrillaris]